METASSTFFRLTKRTEVYNIMPLENMASVMEKGILCYEQATKVQHKSVAMDEVQRIRDGKAVPNGMKLHQYSNSYFDARNPMMYILQERAQYLCVLRIDSKVLDIENAVISDRNASSDYARFYSPQEGISELDYHTIFQKYWTAEEEWKQQINKSKKCAEILVPKLIKLDYVLGAIVVDAEAQQRLKEQGFVKPITIDANLFFRR